jgi:hypothetical protein
VEKLNKLQWDSFGAPPQSSFNESTFKEAVVLLKRSKIKQLRLVGGETLSKLFFYAL